MRLLIALARYYWHKRVKKCDDVKALRFMGRYTSITCYSCAENFWQAAGLFTKR